MGENLFDDCAEPSNVSEYFAFERLPRERGLKPYKLSASNISFEALKAFLPCQPHLE